MWANLGWSEILILLAVFVLLFGAKRFPEFARNLGQGISGFYRGIKGEPNAKPPSLPSRDDDETRSNR